MKFVEGQIGAHLSARGVVRLPKSVHVWTGELCREFQVCDATEHAGPSFWGTQ
jgi:hypothetical protein